MYNLRIEQDDYPHDTPRDWDNLGTMVCWHNRYNLGDEHDYSNSQEWLLCMIAPNEDTDSEWEWWTWADENILPPDIIECWNKRLHHNYIVLPLYLYDHGGITMNTSGFRCPWDSGQVGYIYVSVEDAKKEYGWKRLTQKRRKLIETNLTNEVKTYDQYLTGDVWGWIIEDEDGEHIDSCWGYYGHEYCQQEGQIELDYLLEKEKV
jgi:hypothetical protein